MTKDASVQIQTEEVSYAIWGSVGCCRMDGLPENERERDLDAREVSL
jgi:hypothetical protein